MSDVPIDPRTGRAIIGGRARKMPAPIPVAMPYGNLVHLVDLHARWQPWPKTLCGAWCGEKVTVATMTEPMCPLRDQERSMTFDEIVERLGGVDRTGMTRCPAHEDRTASLKATAGDGKTLLYCHAGCSVNDITAKIGITVEDLFDRRNGHASDIVATYPYTDELGTLLFEVVRKSPKAFLQRRPDGAGGWIWKRADRLVLYNLPRVLKAVANGNTVFITEGEKDADRVIAERYCATTNPMGAGKWSKVAEHARQVLHGADVMVVRDNDEPGRNHADKIVASLKGVAASVTLVEPAQGKDVSDHLAAGLTIDDLLEVTDDVVPPPGDDDAPPTDDDPAFELHDATVAEFAAINEPGAEPIVGTTGDIVIPTGGDVMFYGDGGAGKTTMGLDLAFHLGAGIDWLDLPIPVARGVLLVENEGPRPPFRDKLRRKLAAWSGPDPGDRLRIIDDPWAKLSLARESHRAALAERIATRGVDVVIIGPLATSGMLGAGTPQEARDFLALCADVRQRSGRPVTFIVIHHENKGGKVSGAWEGAGDTLLHVTGMGPGRTRLYLQKVRWSSTWHARKLDLRWTDGEGFEIEDKPEVSDDDLAEAILVFVAAHPGTSWSPVDEAVKGTRGERKRDIRDRLLADGDLVNIVTANGVPIAVDHIPERTRSRLHLGTDPTITHLRPDPDADGTQIAQSALDLG